MEANNAMLDGLMSARADGIRGKLALDLEQIKADLFKQDAMDLDPKADGSSTSCNVGQGRGNATSNAHGFNNEHRGKAHNVYAPPPVRDGRDSVFSPRKISPQEIPSIDTAEHSSFSLYLELPKFDGTNPRLWQNRCEDQ